MKYIREKCETKSLHEICSIASGAYVQNYVSKQEGSLYLRVSDIRKYICNLNIADIVYAPTNHNDTVSRAIVGENDVLIARTGTLGKAALARGPLVGAVMSQHVTRLRVRSADVDPRYLVSFLNSEYGRQQMNYSGFGSTRPELTHAALGQIEIPIIDWKDQKEMGQSVQEAVDRYYESCKFAVSAVEAYERAIKFKLPAVPASIFEISGISDELWTPRYYRQEYSEESNRLRRIFICKTVGEIADIVRGKGTRVAEYATKGIPFVTTTDLVNYGIDPFPDHYATDETYEEFDQEILEGDILFSIEGKIGSVALLTKEDVCVLKNHIQRLRTKGSVSPEQLFLYLASGSGQFQADRLTVVQATIGGLGGRLKDVEIPISMKERDTGYDENLVRAFALVTEAVQQRRCALGTLRKAHRVIESYLEKI
jgi:type I restriction enzyme S subunit